MQIEYSAIEPLEDLTYVTRLDKYCNNFSVDFSYDVKNFDVNLQMFGFGLIPYSNNKNIISEKNNIKAKFINPAFPGDGIVFIIKSKK